MDAIQILTDGAMKAAAELLRKEENAKVRQHPGCYELVAGALRQVAKANLSRILAEWKEATETKIGEGWLQEMVNAQAWEIAIEAMRIVAEEV